jgi:hypothetical protein
VRLGQLSRTGYFFVYNPTEVFMPDSPSEEKVRVTLIMPKWLDREIEIVAAETGQPKNKIVTSALTESLPTVRKRSSPDTPTSRKPSRNRSLTHERS